MRQTDLAASAVGQQYKFSGYTPQLLLIGNVDDDNPVSSIVVEIGGVTYQNVQDQVATQVLSKLAMAGLLGGDVKKGQIIRLADGQIETPGKDCLVTLTNAVAAAYEVHTFSTGPGSKAIVFDQGTITSREKKTFSGIEYLTFPDANFDQADIQFTNGHRESKLGLKELRALFCMSMGVVDANGLLSTYNVVNLISSGIESITIYAGTGGNVTYFRIDV